MDHTAGLTQAPLPLILILARRGRLSRMEEQTMDTFTKRVMIGADHHVHLDLKVPADFPEGEAEATVKLECLAPEENKRNRLREIRGKGEGQFWMSDDFDAPLGEFSEYM
jgi:hypothetical protein